MASQIKVTELWRYPGKSCAGERVEELMIGRRGPERDRAFMVVHAETGAMMTQRDVPQLALIMASFPCENLLLKSYRSNNMLMIEKKDFKNGEECFTNVHTNINLLAIDQGDQAAHWLTNVLGVPSRLVYMSPDLHRFSRSDIAGKTEVGFADAAPLLLISQASLDELNCRLPTWMPRLDMRNFRPNIVVDGVEPHSEDFWRYFLVGNQLELNGAWLCSRCSIPTVNPDTGEHYAKGEPTTTLAKYRMFRYYNKEKEREEQKVFFGINVNHLTHGFLRVGDTITIQNRWAERQF